MQGNPSQCLYISIISGGILPFSANSGKSRSFCFCSYVINNIGGWWEQCVCVCEVCVCV